MKPTHSRMRSPLLRGLIAGAVLSLGSASWAADTNNSAVEDTVITTKVKSALVSDPQTKARQIHVETKNGTVQLNGFVDNNAEKMAAEKVARQVQGVNSVDNNLQLRAAERSAGAVVDDSVITTRVKTALTTDSRVKASDVTVKTNQGTVALGGFVSSDAEKLTAENVASSVPGVVSVQNGIVVNKR